MSADQMEFSCEMDQSGLSDVMQRDLRRELTYPRTRILCAGDYEEYQQEEHDLSWEVQEDIVVVALADYE